jgi:hypothetical protein
MYNDSAVCSLINEYKKYFVLFFKAASYCSSCIISDLWPIWWIIKANKGICMKAIFSWEKGYVRLWSMTIFAWRFKMRDCNTEILGRLWNISDGIGVNTKFFKILLRFKKVFLNFIKYFLEGSNPKKSQLSRLKMLN